MNYQSRLTCLVRVDTFRTTTRAMSLCEKQLRISCSSMGLRKQKWSIVGILDVWKSRHTLLIFVFVVIVGSNCGVSEPTNCLQGVRCSTIWKRLRIDKYRDELVILDVAY